MLREALLVSVLAIAMSTGWNAARAVEEVASASTDASATDDTALSLLADLKPALPDRTDVMQRQLYPIGFSASGAFAWISGSHFPEMDGLAWGLEVRDLVHDRALAGFRGADDANIQDIETAVASRRDELATALRTHGISRRPALEVPKPEPDEQLRIREPASWFHSHTGNEPLLRPLPFLRGPEVFSVEVVPNDEGGGEGYTVRLRSSRRGVKTIGHLDFAPLNTPTAVGVFASPLEPRIAVVLLVAHVPLHGGDPRVLDFTVLGAHLESGFGK